jgi:trans-aconitate 2-methyltransferase
MHEAAVGHPSEDAIRAALRLPRSDEPQDYLQALLATGLTVDAWESTYLHVLDPPAPASTRCSTG